MSRWLDNETWAGVVRNAPLVSIDLLVRHEERTLVGWRTNKPARDSWFVPGGVIRKGEAMAAAFARITEAELGQHYPLAQSQLHGVYEHFYEDNFSDDDGFGTHYVVLARQLKLSTLPTLPKQQHSKYCWLTDEEMRANTKVHRHVKWYFNS